MSILDFKATREEWLTEIYNKSKSDPSKHAYSEGIKKWDEFLSTISKTDEEVLLELKQNNNNPDSYLFLNKFIQYMIKRGNQRGSIDVAFTALRSWCAINGVMLFNEYVKRFVKLPKKNKETKVPLNRDMIKGLIVNAPNNVRVVLLVLLSSGMRVGECLQLRVKDIDTTKIPIEIKLRAETTKTREERKAYISQEAWAMVEPLLLNKDKEDYVFVKSFGVNSVRSIEVLFGRLRKNLGYTEKYDNGRNYQVNIHAFRANFITTATKILDGDTAHALAGHHKYMDVYFRMSPESRAEQYSKLEPYLTLSDEMRQKGIIQEKEKTIQELKKRDEKLAKLEAKIKRLEKLNS